MELCAVAVRTGPHQPMIIHLLQVHKHRGGKRVNVISVQPQMVVVRFLIQEVPPVCFCCGRSVPLEQHFPHAFVLKYVSSVSFPHLRTQNLHSWPLSPPIIPDIQ